MSEHFKVVSAMVGGEKCYFQDFEFSEKDDSMRVLWNRQPVNAKALKQAQWEFMLKELPEICEGDASDFNAEEPPEGFVYPTNIIDESYLTIDSAPRDGTLIVVADYERSMEMSWVSDAAGLVMEDGGELEIDGIWLNEKESEGWPEIEGDGPTHWKPIRKNFN